MFKGIKRFILKLKKLYIWNKLLLDDFDWDHSYLLKIIQLKLEMMEPVIRDGYALNSDKTADEIKKALEYLNLLIEDDFTRHQNELDNKFGKNEFIKLPNGNFTIERSGVTEQNKEEFRKEFNDALDADFIEKEVIKRKFLLLLKNYENWWD